MTLTHYSVNTMIHLISRDRMLPRQEYRQRDRSQARDGSRSHSSTFVAQKPRPVPYHLQKPLKEWLEQEVKENILILRKSQMEKPSHGANP